MKHCKHIAAILLFCLLICPTAHAAEQEPGVRIMVDGNAITQEFSMQDGRVVMPLRNLIDAMNGEVVWMPNSQEIIVQRTVSILGETADKDQTLTYTANLRIGETQAVYTAPDVSADTISLMVAPTILDGKTLVSVRDVATMLGACVTWYHYTKTVWIETL